MRQREATCLKREPKLRVVMRSGGRLMGGGQRHVTNFSSKMAVNEALLGGSMTNFTLPSPKRHRKYEETGIIHDEV